MGGICIPACFCIGCRVAVSLIIGDDVTVDGKCNFHFGARHSVPAKVDDRLQYIIGHGPSSH